jgi:hypothetical protein
VSELWRGSNLQKIEEIKQTVAESIEKGFADNCKK